ELMQTTLDRDEYVMARGYHVSLPDEIFGLSLCRYLRSLPEKVGATRTVPLERLLLGELSPGTALRLSEDALVQRLARVCALKADLWNYDETAGMYQLIVSGEVAEFELLRDYYAREGMAEVA